MLFSVFVHACSFYLFHISTFSSYIGGFMNENDRTTLEQAIYEEMELTSARSAVSAFVVL